MAVDEAGHDREAAAVNPAGPDGAAVAAPLDSARDKPTEAMRPLRTTRVPDSMTEPLPTTMRALEMTRFWARAAVADRRKVARVRTRTTMRFMASL
jgi:hypothetical protein